MKKIKSLLKAIVIVAIAVTLMTPGSTMVTNAMQPDLIDQDSNDYENLEGMALSSDDGTVSFPQLDGWPVLTVGSNPASNPVIGDIDGDGDMEVVIGSTFNQIHAWHHDGTSVDGWPQNYGASSYISSPALADFDSDGDLEIVMAVGDSLYIWHHDGNLVNGWPRVIVEFGSIRSSPSIADLDNDGELEILTAGTFIMGIFYYHCVWAFNFDGTPVPGWPVISIHGCFDSSPSVGDIDGDGDVEVVIGGGWLNRHIYAWHHDGTPVDGWPIDLFDLVSYASPSLADLDADGDLEIIIGARIFGSTNNLTRNRVYAWHHDGTLVDGWPQLTNGYVDTSAGIGDIDGDGDLEIVVFSDDQRIYAWHHDGTLVDGWPQKTNDVQFESKLWGPKGMTSVTLGDIDGDSDIEVLVNAKDNQIHAYHHNGTIVSGWPIKLGVFDDSAYSIRCYACSTPTIADVDRDEDIEVVVGSYNRSSYKGKVHAWDLNGTYNITTMVWPMFQQNPHHTGLYPHTFLVNAGGHYTELINEPLQFTGSATGGIPPYSWHWDFGDGNTSDEESASNIYSISGNYTVTVTVTDNENNCTSDTTKAIIKEEIDELIADANGPYVEMIRFYSCDDSSEHSGPIYFTGSASGGYLPYTWHWDFGDGETSNEQNPIHTYDEADTYTVTFTVTDRKGYIASNSTIATIAERLEAEAEPMPGVEGLINEPIQFYGSAAGGFPPYNWHWDFGDGNTSEEQNPNHSYSKANRYTVRLKVTDKFGYRDFSYSIFAKITEEKNPIVEIRKPEKALYINNKEILPFFTPIIIKGIDIRVKAFDAYFTIDRVEFYVDNELKHNDTQLYCWYNWTWNERTPLKFRHTIKVIAYDRFGFYNSDEITVWKFL